MPRNPAPFHSIVHLKLLMELYVRHYQIPQFPDLTSEKHFFEKLTSCLSNDKIVEEKSKNLVNKLYGFPFQKSAKEAEGIDTEKIEAFAQCVWEHCSLSSNFPDINEFYWAAFQEVVASMPEHLKHLQDKRYYKYLSDAERQMVDDFIDRKINEIAPPAKDLAFYNLYYWNESERNVETAVLTLNHREEVAIVKYVYLVDGQLKTKTVQRTDQNGGLYKLNNNTLYLNCVEEDVTKQHLRTNFAIAVYDSDYPSLKYLKGTYSASRQNATHPVAGTLILEKKDNFKEALDTIRDKKVPEEIQLELMDEHFICSNEKLRSLSDLDTSRHFKALQLIKGVYFIGFLKKEPNGNGNREITTGICCIYPSGKVLVNMIHKPHFTGSILRDIDMATNVVALGNFYNSEGDDYRYTYYLEMIKTQSKDAIERLEGVYAGLSQTNNSPRAGKIVLVKDTSNKGFAELSQEFPPSRITMTEAKNGDILAYKTIAVRLEEQVEEYIIT